MGHILYRWLFQDFWVLVWPNLAAATIPTVTVVQLVRVVKRHHREHMSLLRKVAKMPYKIEKDGENYKVINEDTGEVKAVHEPPDAKEKAERQVRLLHGVEHEWEPTNG